MVFFLDWVTADEYLIDVLTWISTMRCTRTAHQLHACVKSYF